MNTTDRTPADLLRSALATDPGRPLVTYYDDATGERVELSVATLANWVSKTANLLQGDVAAEPGDRAVLLLPAHWQTAVWLLACSSTGVAAAPGGDPRGADLAVSGPGAEQLEAARACTGERIALSLRPLGARFPQPPEGFHDYAVEVPGQGDQFAPLAPVSGDDVFLELPDGTELTGEEAVRRAREDAAALGLEQGSRLLTGGSYDDWEGISTGLLAPLAAGASVVLCRNLQELDPAALDKRKEDERVTHTAV
ncbi:TIGR03089 family protein [Streptomyces sp. ODS28]|uniref:TIGR03089 family protein n=1 Tax=Streptomyces sp. ODS28 TaxID=3136688 RepID=UPI0031EA31D5